MSEFGRQKIVMKLSSIMAALVLPPFKIVRAASNENECLLNIKKNKKKNVGVPIFHAE